ncbi:Sorting nexin-10B [Holothuria leucospilota]|uniref:Sorting nexin-10B n=1 Tax=Holothuria leucospilota TaxID=206669 RepID=A0A9Q1H586_HOLLE|nr:Sorting nexin-10B [Holothuria leucospilota]
MSENWLDEDALLYPEISSLIEVTHHDMEEDSWGRKFVTYSIEIQTNDISFNLPHSKVKRRFSDFVWLRKRILSVSPVHKRNIARLPRRYLFSRIDQDVIAERQHGLQRFLQEVLQSETVLSDPCVHLLLQSTLSVSDIEEWMKSPKRQPSSKIILEGKDLVTPDRTDIQHYLRPPSRTSDNRSLCASTVSDDFPSSPTYPINVGP